VVGRETGAIADAISVVAMIAVCGRLMMALVVAVGDRLAGGVRRTRTVEAADGEQRDKQVRKSFPGAQHA
jgi:hypothetical protein